MLSGRRGGFAVLFLAAATLGPACGARTDTSQYDVPDGAHGGGGQGGTAGSGATGAFGGSGAVAGTTATGGTAGNGCRPQVDCTRCGSCLEECRCLGIDVPCDAYCGIGGNGGMGAVAGSSGFGGSGGFAGSVAGSGGVGGACSPGSACDACPDCISSCLCRGGNPMECPRACGGGTGGGTGGFAGSAGMAGAAGFGAACGEQLLGLSCTDVALGDTPECQDCGYGPCCDPLSRCFGDPACAAFVECYSIECGQTPDPERCVRERCAPCSTDVALELFNQIGFCVQSRCPACQ